MATVLLAICTPCSCYYESVDQENGPEYADTECGPPTGQVYDDHFWFIQITDPHLSRQNGSDLFDFAFPVKGTYENFLEQLRYIHDVVKPAFVVNTGDLVDGGILEQVPEQWKDYCHGVWDACYDQTTYHDLPGNHDVYYDPDSSYYQTYSISRVLHHSWAVENDSGRFAFVAMNSTMPGSNDADLPAQERAWLIDELEAAGDDEYRILFAHHNTPQEKNLDLFGPDGLLAAHRVNAFVAGHIHKNMEINDSGILYVITDAMYKPGPAVSDGVLRIFSFDGLSMASAPKTIKNNGPQVLISSPQDLFHSTQANPFGHVISGTTDVRVLAFWPEPVSITVSVDEKASFAADRAGESRYGVEIDFDAFEPGIHVILAWAEGFEDAVNATDRIEVISQ